MKYTELERLAREEAARVRGTRVGRLKRFVVESIREARDNLEDSGNFGFPCLLPGISGIFLIFLEGTTGILFPEDMSGRLFLLGLSLIMAGSAHSLDSRGRARPQGDLG